MSTHELNREHHELISALMDGELSDAERTRVLDRLQKEPELQTCWARYHATRAGLTGGAARLSPGFSERVHQALAQEPTVLAPGARPRRTEQPGWLRPVAGFAIAASVALVAVGGLTWLRGPGGDAGDAGTTVAELDGADGLSNGGATDASGVAQVGASSSSLALDTTARQAEIRRRLGIYLANHSEYAGAGEMPGMIPYSRLTGFNAGQ